MDDKSAGTEELGGSAFVDAFSISIGDLVTTTGNATLKLGTDIDSVPVVELEGDKVAATY